MPPSSILGKEKDRPLSRKRSPSVLHKVLNFARNASGSKTPPNASPSPSRSASLQPASPLLLPTTTNVTAPGSILKTGHHSPTLAPADAHQFETSVEWLASHITTLTASQVVAHIAKLERTLLAPGHTRPVFSAVHTILSYTCSPQTHSTIRQTGFTFLCAYLEAPSHEFPGQDDGLDSALIWHFVRSSTPISSTLGSFLSDDDWEQRLRVLQILTSMGGNIEGLTDLISTLCTWQIDALEAMPPGTSRSLAVPSDVSDERVSLQRRASEIQRFLINICLHNISSLTEAEEECIIVAFLKALEIAIRDGHISRFNSGKDRAEAPGE